MNFARSNDVLEACTSGSFDVYNLTFKTPKNKVEC